MTARDSKSSSTPSRFPTPGDPLRISIHGLFALALLYTLYFAREVLLPITLAVLASLLLAPLVRGFYRRGVPRGVSAMILLLSVVLLSVAMLAATVKPMVEWMEEAPEGISRILVEGGEYGDLLETMSDSAREVEEELSEALEEEGAEPVVVQEESWRDQLAVGVRESLSSIALALALSFFLLVNGDQLIRHFVRQLPGRQRRLTALRVIRDSQREVGQYLAFITVSNGLVGVATGLMVWGLGLPSPALWGVVAALLRFIPYLGVIVTVLLLAVVASATHTELWMIAAAPLGYWLLSSLVGFFLEPYLHGFRMAINPILIFVAIFVWGWLWGPIGVLIAVPLMTVIQVFLRRIDRLRPVYRVIAR